MTLLDFLAILFPVIRIFCVVLCVFFVVRYSYWRRRKIPSVALKFPYIFGNVSREKHQAIQFTDFYKDHCSLYAHDTKNHPIIGIYMFFEPSVLIVDLELIKCILTEKFSHFQNRGMYYNERDDPLSAILGTLNHEKWKPLRKQLTPAFTGAKIKEMFETMKTVGDELVKGLDEIIVNDQQVEIRKLFSRFTIDVIGKVAIGIQCDTLNKSTLLGEMAKKAMQPYLSFPWNHLTIAHPDFARFLRIRKHPKEVSDFFVDIVEQTIQYRKENNEKRNDYMQMLIDSGLKTNEIAALAFDLLSAGYADATSTLAYCLYELSNNEPIQRKARTEIQSVLAENNGQMTYEALNKMTYCKKIIKETLRKHPVAGNATRITTEPFKVPNTDFTIPKGMRVFIPIYAIHHDEAIYPEPEQFIPERFNEDFSEDSNTFLAFGKGPRHCIGSRFATLLVTVGLVSLLKNFEFATCERTQIPIQYSATKNTLIPNDGVWLKVNRI